MAAKVNPTRPPSTIIKTIHQVKDNRGVNRLATAESIMKKFSELKASLSRLGALLDKGESDPQSLKDAIDQALSDVYVCCGLIPAISPPLVIKDVRKAREVAETMRKIIEIRRRLEDGKVRDSDLPEIAGRILRCYFNLQLGWEVV